MADFIVILCLKSQPISLLFFSFHVKFSWCVQDSPDVWGSKLNFLSLIKESKTDFITCNLIFTVVKIFLLIILIQLAALHDQEMLHLFFFRQISPIFQLTVAFSAGQSFLSHACTYRWFKGSQNLQWIQFVLANILFFSKRVHVLFVLQCFETLIKTALHSPICQSPIISFNYCN